MYQIADNQLSETMDLLTVIQSVWNGMVGLRPAISWRDRSEFSTMVLVLVLVLHHWLESTQHTVASSAARGSCADSIAAVTETAVNRERERERERDYSLQ